MSLKVYINSQTKDFLKDGVGNGLFGIQIAPTYKLLQIQGAYIQYPSASADTLTAVKIDSDGNEISRTTLSTTLILTDTATNQYLIDQTKTLSTYLDECIYYLEYIKDSNLYETEPFLVQEMSIPFSADINYITADSNLYTADKTTLTI